MADRRTVYLYPGDYPGVKSFSVERVIEYLGLPTQRVTGYRIDVNLSNGKVIQACIPVILVDPPPGGFPAMFEWAAALVFTEWDWRVARGENAPLIQALDNGTLGVE